MSDSRFEELLGRLLDDELAADEWSELFLLVRQEPARLLELQDQLETADLLAQSEDDLRRDALFVAATRSRLLQGEDGFVAGVRSAISKDGQASPPPVVKPGPWLLARAHWPRAVAAAALVALVATLFAIQPSSAPPIATITSSGGSLLWIGDGGHVSRDIGVGSSLSGGTLEAVSADSWAALEFRDGSNVTVSGPSLLTISDDNQKQLHLRQGSLFAKVAKQALGRPMLIHTRTAELEVLGTQLNVEAESATTRLSVDEGRVRLTRLVDGSTAEVTTRHQLVATADRSQALEPTPRPDPVNNWTSQLTASMGKWLPPESDLPARLRALPLVFNLPREGPLALYVVGFGVPQCGASPVRLEAGSRFRVQGRMQSLQDLRFGITAKHPEGGFGGKFETDIPAKNLNETGGRFDIEIKLSDLKSLQPRFPAPPVLSELQDCYLLTINVEAGLEVMQVELLPPE